MEVTGRIKLIGQPQDISSSFRKRELVVTTEEQYPQHLMIEFIQDKVSLLDSFQVGEPVRVSINLRGREWTSPQGELRYFNTIQGWRIERLVATQPNQPSYDNQGYADQNMQNNSQQQNFQGQQNQGMNNNFGQNQGTFNQQGGNAGMQQNNMNQQNTGFGGNQNIGFANNGNQNQGFAQGNQNQGFNQGNQQQNPFGNSFPPASSYNEEDHDDLPF